MSVAVVDLETTGVLPSVDRVVEVGVLLDDAGVVEHEFSTLIDPGRDIGPTSGKARKARALGVRVISEAVFWESLSLVG